MFEQHGAGGGGVLLGELAQLAVGEGSQLFDAAVFLLLGYGVGYLQGACAGAFGVWEDMEAGDGEGVEEVARRSRSLDP